jgi:hypothetical protein
VSIAEPLPNARGVTPTHALFVVPRAHGDGFQASIRGHMLELADPRSGHELAPTPDDLQVASIASELAWAAQRLLRAHGLPDEVSVAAEWDARSAGIDVTVSVSSAAETVTAALAATFDQSLAARATPAVRIAVDGAPG